MNNIPPLINIRTVSPIETIRYIIISLILIAKDFDYWKKQEKKSIN